MINDAQRLAGLSLMVIDFAADLRVPLHDLTGECSRFVLVAPDGNVGFIV